ncbi:MAG: ATP-binding protein [Dictyoglomus sp. NZ13-RE01]|nr:MAG: ATP-binding protein [Dictyoglomus sp. NZ13-RE01]
MKILVLGKGGAGKSTVSALLAKSFAKKGFKVWVLDGDESNFGLYRHLGINPPEELMNLYGGKKGISEKLRRFFTERESVKITDTVSKEEIPKEYIAEKDGISLSVIGKIKDFGEGCACPMGALLRNFLKSLVLKEKEIVIVDTDAGIEHLGRGVEEGCDLCIFVIDPTYESIMLSKKVKEMLKETGKELIIVLNKVNDENKEILLKHLEDEISCIIPQNKEILESGLKGEEINIHLPEIDNFTSTLIEKFIS